MMLSLSATPDDFFSFLLYGQIFKSFLFGFPQNWESCALGCFREEAEAGAYSVNVMDNVSTVFEEISADGK
jgi:hypothetical protein